VYAAFTAYWVDVMCHDKFTNINQHTLSLSELREGDVRTPNQGFADFIILNSAGIHEKP
jgi:hypothetical protein